jgi:hypothetical protein
MYNFGTLEHKDRGLGVAGGTNFFFLLIPCGLKITMHLTLIVTASRKQPKCNG